MIKRRVGQTLKLVLGVKGALGIIGVGYAVKFPPTLIAPFDLNQDQPGTQLKVQDHHFFPDGFVVTSLQKGPDGTELDNGILGCSAVSLQRTESAREAGPVATIDMVCKRPGIGEIIIVKKDSRVNNSQGEMEFQVNEDGSFECEGANIVKLTLEITE